MPRRSMWQARRALYPRANFSASQLRNVSGPTIGIGGNGNVTLTGSSASGSGEWLRVGTINDFPPMAAPDAGPGGITDPEGLETPPIFTAPAARGRARTRQRRRR